MGMKVGVVAGSRILNHFAPEQVPNGESPTTAPHPHLPKKDLVPKKLLY